MSGCFPQTSQIEVPLAGEALWQDTPQLSLPCFPRFPGGPPSPVGPALQLADSRGHTCRFTGWGDFVDTLCVLGQSAHLGKLPFPYLTNCLKVSSAASLGRAAGGQ